MPSVTQFSKYRRLRLREEQRLLQDHIAGYGRAEIGIRESGRDLEEDPLNPPAIYRF